MPKKSTGYTPTGKSKRSAVEKQSTPMKAPSLKMQGLPAAIKSPNSIANMPKGKIGKPIPLAPRQPRI